MPGWTVRAALGHPGLMDRSQLRGWIEDALARHDRDAAERGEEVTNVTVDEIVDAVWGRLPLEVRREVSRAQVQASLTVMTLRRGIAMGRPDGLGPPVIPPSNGSVADT